MTVHKPVHLSSYGLGDQSAALGAVIEFGKFYQKHSAPAILYARIFSVAILPCAGTKVVRQMQRLRRLCGSHQQCVAYSSPELASEISSIVHAARHHSGLESNSNSSHRRCSKVGLQRLSKRVRHNACYGHAAHLAKSSKLCLVRVQRYLGL